MTAAGSRRRQAATGSNRGKVASVRAAQVDEVAEEHAAEQQGLGGDGAEARDELHRNGAVALSEFDGPGEGVRWGKLGPVAGGNSEVSAGEA